jgi:hypothetical protein
MNVFGIFSRRIDQRTNIRYIKKLKQRAAPATVGNTIDEKFAIKAEMALFNSSGPEGGAYTDRLLVAYDHIIPQTVQAARTFSAACICTVCTNIGIEAYVVNASAYK